MVCEESCSIPRPDGCNHPCLLPCHPEECPPCRQMIRMRCHCQLIVQHVECFKWTDASDREKTRLRSCPGRCPKMVNIVINISKIVQFFPLIIIDCNRFATSVTIYLFQHFMHMIYFSLKYLCL